MDKDVTALGRLDVSRYRQNAFLGLEFYLEDDTELKNWFFASVDDKELDAPAMTQNSACDKRWKMYENCCITLELEQQKLIAPLGGNRGKKRYTTVKSLEQFYILPFWLAPYNSKTKKTIQPVNYMQNNIEVMLIKKLAQRPYPHFEKLRLLRFSITQ
jgi:hypothetical protein